MTDHVALVGTGLIGRSWAVVFARAGRDVRLFDPAPGQASAARSWVMEALGELEAIGALADAPAAAARVSVASTLAEAVAGAAYVQESGPEDTATKRALFSAMDAAAPDAALIGSSVSAIPPSSFMDGLDGRARCLGVHPVNPPHLVPLVELVPSRWTSEDAVRRVAELMSAVGQSPIRVRQEVPGFVLNRLQAAVINEAVSLVARGVCDPEDADRAMTDGLGLRWAFMGPFETMDLNAPGGFLDYATRYRGGYAGLGRDLRVADPWPDDALSSIEAWRRSELAKEDILRRQRWRDRRLAGLLAQRAAAEP
jgi:L-gulonate 3-dehydrogenase